MLAIAAVLVHLVLLCAPGTRHGDSYPPSRSGESIDVSLGGDRPPRRSPAASEGAVGPLAVFVASVQNAVLRGDLGGVQAAIAELAALVCGDVLIAPEALDAARRLAQAGEARAAGAVVQALGRCGSRVVLDLLLEVVQDRAAGGLLRNAAILSLGQRRETDLRMRVGAGYLKGDSILDGPIAEPDVRRVLLRVLVSAWDEHNADWMTETPLDCIAALGGSVGVDIDVAATLLRVGDPRGGLAPLVFAAMQSAGPQPACIAFALGVARDPEVQGGAATAAATYLARVAPSAAAQLASESIRDPRARPGRVLEILDGLGGMGAVAAEDVGVVEACLLEAWEWAQAHPVLTATASSGTEGLRTTPGETDTRSRVFVVISNSLTGLAGRSAVLLPIAAEALYWRMRSPDPIPGRSAERLAKSVIGLGQAAALERLLALMDRELPAAERAGAALRGARSGLADERVWQRFAPVIDRILARLPEEIAAGVRK